MNCSTAMKLRPAFGRWLLLATCVALFTVTAHAQRITSGHLNVGALGTGAGSQLSFVNGAAFALNSGYVQMDMTASGTYAGYYGGGPSVTALPQTVAHGGPNPNAPSLGSYIQASITLQSAPLGGAFSFWDTDAVVPTFSLSTAGAVSPMWNLSGGEENPTAGAAGADPYGHIHGRRFTATVPGEYIIGFQAFDTSLNGAQHAASSVLQIRFLAVPEPSSVALMALGGVMAGVWFIRRPRA